MVKDGDKILICLSGSSSSLCLLHALRQFSRARRIHIELGAITIGESGVDPRVMMLYMRDLGIEFILEQHGKLNGWVNRRVLVSINRLSCRNKRCSFKIMCSSKTKRL